MIRQRARTLMLGAALLGASLSPLAASAQSQLDIAEARAFLGSWVISMTSDFGAFTMNLEITDQMGKVAASIGSPDMGGPVQNVTDITRSGESLVLGFGGDFQGTPYDAAVTLEPAGEDLSVWFEVNQGEFAVGGTATRAGS